MGRYEKIYKSVENYMSLAASEPEERYNPSLIYTPEIEQIIILFDSLKIKAETIYANGKSLKSVRKAN
jgi:hypothetical protein